MSGILELFLSNNFLLAVVGVVALVWCVTLLFHLRELSGNMRLNSLLNELMAEFNYQLAELYDGYEDGDITLDALGCKEEFLRNIYAKMADDLQAKHSQNKKNKRVKSK